MCDVDYNVYTEDVNPKPKGEITNLRSAGCHIHLGYKNPNIDTSLLIIRYLDMYLGIPSILKDTDTRRRELYGKAGCFRLTPYGLEYRVLSSKMIDSPENIKFIIRQTYSAVRAYTLNYTLCDPQTVVNIIDNNNVELAKKVIEKYCIL